MAHKTLLLLESPRVKHYLSTNGNGVGGGNITYSHGDGFSNIVGQQIIDMTGCGWDVVSIDVFCDGSGNGEENPLHLAGNGMGHGRDYNVT